MFGRETFFRPEESRYPVSGDVGHGNKIITGTVPVLSSDSQLQ